MDTYHYTIPGQAALKWFASTQCMHTFINNRQLPYLNQESAENNQIESMWLDRDWNSQPNAAFHQALHCLR